MKLAVLFGRLAAVLLCVAIAAAASARELRHPARGVPAFTMQLPDDWTYSVGTDNALVAVSQDRSTSIVLSFGADRGSLEDFAREMFLVAGAAAPADTTPASISGLSGFSLESTMKNGKGELLQLKLTIVRIGERRHGSATMLQHAGNSPEQRQSAENVMRSVQIIGAGR
jgi:hypothetical protein